MRSTILFFVIVCALVAQAPDLPEGKGRAELMNLCGSCHGVDTVTHTRNTPKGWKQTVDDMFARGAAGSDDEAGLIVNYLARNFGQKVNVNSGTGDANAWVHALV